MKFFVNNAHNLTGKTSGKENEEKRSAEKKWKGIQNRTTCTGCRSQNNGQSMHIPWTICLHFYQRYQIYIVDVHSVSSSFTATIAADQLTTWHTCTEHVFWLMKDKWLYSYSYYCYYDLFEQVIPFKRAIWPITARYTRMHMWCTRMYSCVDIHMHNCVYYIYFVSHTERENEIMQIYENFCFANGILVAFSFLSYLSPNGKKSELKKKRKKDWKPKQKQRHTHTHTN